MHFVNFLCSTAVSRSLTPNLKAMPRRDSAKAEPNVVHLIFFPFYCVYGWDGMDRMEVSNLRMDGMDGMGWDGMEYQKCPSNFFRLCENIENV